MDDASTEPDDDLVVVTSASTGLLVTGEPHSVNAYIEALHDRLHSLGQPVTATTVGDTVALGATVASVAYQRGNFVQLSQRSMELLANNQAIPGQTGGFVQGAVRGAKGRFGGTLEFRKVPLGPSQAAMLQTAAVAAALRVAVESVQASVEAVEGKVDELMARARARDIGPSSGTTRSSPN